MCDKALARGRPHDFELRCDFDVFDLARTEWDWLTIGAQTLDVEDDGFADFGLNFSDSCTRGDAAREVWDIRRIVTFGFFDDDGVAHKTSQLKTSLLLNTVQSSGRQIVARPTGNSDATRLARVLELSVTPTSYNQVPTIGLEHSQDFADLHGLRIAGPPVPTVRLFS